jgi:glycine/D-amino acid oxidase-like deaminating enzyme
MNGGALHAGDSQEVRPMHVVICGGGVIGTAMAYELSKRSVDVTLLERWRVGGSASGKSGGFLARDWCDGSPVAELAHRSFDLHQVWAEELENPYGYRRIDTYGAVLAQHQRQLRSQRSDVAGAEWLSPTVANRQRIGDATSTAQLDPAAFTNALMDGAIAKGARLEIATVAGLSRSSDGAAVTGVTLADGRNIAADAVVLALGPWSLLAAQWIEVPAIYGLKGHSLIFKPDRPLPPEAVFAEVYGEDGDVHTPEIVSRADGTVYVCGLPGRGGLPVDPSQVHPEEGGCEKLRDITLRLVPALKDAEIIAEQACYRPVTADGLPLIGPIGQCRGVYLATGHSVWGMLNAPGTAEALADVMLGGESAEVSLAPFSPARLAPLDTAELGMRAR